MNFSPFGLKHKGYNNVVSSNGNSTAQKFGYNGVELNESLGLNLMEMDFRLYDPAIGRFNGIDPVTHHSQGTSVAFDNNPIFWADPSGADAIEFDGTNLVINWDEVDGSATWTNPNTTDENNNTENCCDWIDGLKNWFEGDKSYKGSGWGHGFRTWIKNKFDVDDEASNVIMASVLSILQSKKVNLTGSALNKVSVDSGVIKYEASIILKAMADKNFKKKAFSFTTNKLIGCGGQRKSGSIADQLLDPFNEENYATWKVAVNELTWLVRNTNVSSTISVDKSGKITITHQFSDVLDLRGSAGRSDEYNKATGVLGYLYHDILGGNDKMKVKAKWSTTHKK
jgi:RHS repeat-associated protein